MRESREFTELEETMEQNDEARSAWRSWGRSSIPLATFVVLAIALMVIIYQNLGWMHNFHLNRDEVTVEIMPTQEVSSGIAVMSPWNVDVAAPIVVSRTIERDDDGYCVLVVVPAETVHALQRESVEAEYHIMGIDYPDYSFVLDRDILSNAPNGCGVLTKVPVGQFFSLGQKTAFAVASNAYWGCGIPYGIAILLAAVCDLLVTALVALGIVAVVVLLFVAMKQLYLNSPLNRDVG